MIKVTAPDGEVIEFPESMSDDDIDAAMQEMYPSPDSAPPIPEPSMGPTVPQQTPMPAPLQAADDLIRSLAGGAAFGRADEFAATAREATGGPAYDVGVAEERERDKAIHPAIAIPGEIAGGIASTVAASPVTLPMKAAAPFVSKLPGWLKATGLGGMFGSLYGSGHAEEGDKLKGAAYGGAAGAATGAVTYPIIRGLQAGLGKIGREISERTDPYKAALRELDEAVKLDELTPARLRARLRNLGPQGIVADAGGENVLGVARRAAGIPGVAKNRAAIALGARADKEGTRIGAVLNRNLSPKDFYAAEEGFLKSLREQAAPLYREAYQQNTSLMTPRLKRLLGNKRIQRALKEARDIVDDEYASGQAKYLGAVDDELTEAMRFAASVGKMDRPGSNTVARGFSLETWDQIKRGLDSVMQGKAYSNEITGKLNQRGRAVDQLRRSLIKELDRATGGEGSVYSKARATYSGDAEVLGALRDGRNALKLDPEMIRRQLGGLSDAGKEAYRTGAARAIKDTVDKVQDAGSAAKRVFGNTLNRNRYRAIFPDPEAFNAFAKTMISEKQFANTKFAVLGGSQTAPRLAEAAGRDAGAIDSILGSVGAVAGSQVPGTHALVGSGIGRRVATSLFGPSGELERELSKFMFNRNQSMNQQTLDKLMDYAANKQLSTEQFANLCRILLGITAQQEGRAIGQSQRP